MPELPYGRTASVSRSARTFRPQENRPRSNSQPKSQTPTRHRAGAGGRGGRGGGRGGPQRPATVIAKTADGHEYRGVQKGVDSFTVQLVDTDGVFHSFEKAKLADLKIEPTVAHAGRLLDAALFGRDAERRGLSEVPHGQRCEQARGRPRPHLGPHPQR